MKAISRKQRFFDFQFPVSLPNQAESTQSTQHSCLSLRPAYIFSNCRWGVLISTLTRPRVFCCCAGGTGHVICFTSDRCFGESREAFSPDNLLGLWSSDVLNPLSVYRPASRGEHTLVVLCGRSLQAFSVLRHNFNTLATFSGVQQARKQHGSHEFNLHSVRLLFQVKSTRK